MLRRGHGGAELAAAKPAASPTAPFSELRRKNFAAILLTRGISTAAAKEKKPRRGDRKPSVRSFKRTIVAMRLREIYLEIRPEDIAYVKFILESYEGVGIVRTVERKKAVIVLLIVEDFLDEAHNILNSIEKEISLVPIPRPAALGDDWLMQELDAESDEY